MKSLILTVDPLTFVTVPAMAGVGLWPSAGPFGPSPPNGPRNPKPNRPGPPGPGSAADCPELGSANDWVGSLGDADWLAAAGLELAELGPPEPAVTAQTMPNAPPARP